MNTKLGKTFWRDALGIVIILVVVSLVTEFGIFYNSHPNYYKRISTYFYLFLPSLSLLLFISYNYQRRTKNFIPTAQSIRYRFLIFFLLTALLPSVPVFIISSDVIQRSIDRYLLLDVENLYNLPRKSLTLHYRPYYHLALQNRSQPLCNQRLIEVWGQCLGVEESDDKIIYSGDTAKNYYEFYLNYVNKKNKTTIDFFILPSKNLQGVAMVTTAKRKYFFPLNKEQQEIFIKGLQVSQKYQSIIYFVDPLKKVIDFFLAVLLVFVLVITILIAFMISKNITDPIVQLSNAVRGVFSGKISYVRNRVDRVINQKAPGEIHMLAESIQKMVVQIEEFKDQQYHIQKNLAWQDVARKMAHEIKNPLTPIQLSIERITRQLRKHETEVPKEYQKIIKETSASVLRQVNVIKNILDSLSRMYRMPLPHKLEVNLVTILEDLSNENQSEGIEILLKIEDDDLFLQADADQLKRAFLNILQNARQALEWKKVVIQRPTVYIGAKWAEKEKEILVFFLDNGPGISAENIKKVTEANFTTKESGEGLGLSIAKKIFSDHDAEISILSTEEDQNKNEEGETNVTILFQLDK